MPERKIPSKAANGCNCLNSCNSESANPSSRKSPRFSGLFPSPLLLKSHLCQSQVALDIFAEKGDNKVNNKVNYSEYYK
ncbi:hypothetical protein BAG01nite_45600 [Brevibacillus agri]|uniref:Uncharacterized protein n=1 Tax=Brevibacillus agri TaxID=51101 RepID=A0ABQ0SXE7_9BACL|nr:hypothetical protein BAG01nite_45600 [Brevibacillus agri]